MANATLDRLEADAAQSRERAQRGSQRPLSKQEMDDIYSKGAKRRVASTMTLGIASKWVAFGGHYAARDALREKTGMTRSEAAQSEKSGQLLRGTGVFVAGATAVGVVSAVAAGGVAALATAPVLVPAAVGVAVAVAAKSIGNRMRTNTTQRNAAKAQERTIAAQERDVQQQAPAETVPEQAPQRNTVQAASVHQIGPGRGAPQRGRQGAKVAA